MQALYDFLMDRAMLKMRSIRKKIISDMVFIYWILMKLPFLQIIFTSFTIQAQYFPWISLTNLKSEYIFALKIVIQGNVLLLPHTLSVNFEPGMVYGGIWH